MVVIFGVDNSLSSHADDCKNIFLVLSEGPTDDIKSCIGAAKKKFSINFSTAKTKFCLSLHYNHHNSYLFVNRKIHIKKLKKLKADDKNAKFPTQLC